VPPGIDYKQLTDGQHNPLDIIKPILSEDNVSAIAKLAPHIRDRVMTLFHLLQLTFSLRIFVGCLLS